MQIGKFYIEQLSEGFFEVFADGSLHKIESERIGDVKSDPSLGKYSSVIGIDPLFISDGHLRIVVDPGLGWGLDHSSKYKNTSNVATNLDIFGLLPSDIDFVILSHLHYDHAAGCTFVNSDFKTTATFPNAVYLIQIEEWEYAIKQSSNVSNQLTGTGYQMDELYKLKAEERIQFVENEIHPLMPGFELIHTGGHTPGHQIVRLKSKNQSAYYLGDLIPAEHHLNHSALKKMDTDPLLSNKIKTTLLREVLQSDAYLLFYHSLYNKSGKLAQNEEKNTFWLK
ncbi:MAG: MBL fold metallo-hydrolase [Balneolaceae bacterium]